MTTSSKHYTVRDALKKIKSPVILRFGKVETKVSKTEYNNQSVVRILVQDNGYEEGLVRYINHDDACDITISKTVNDTILEKRAGTPSTQQVVLQELFSQRDRINNPDW